MSKKNNKIYFSVMKNNPKPNAKEYELKTIDDIFQILTIDNIKRFMADFEAGMTAQIHLRESFKAFTEVKNPELPKNAAGLKMETLKWIDD